jgi:FG-GAP-like repeat/FG-GAP repeat
MTRVGAALLLILGGCTQLLGFEEPTRASDGGTNGGKDGGPPGSDGGAGTACTFRTAVFMAPVSYPAGSTPSGFDAGDVDGQGNPWVVVANRDSAFLSVLQGKGAGALQVGPQPQVAISCNGAVDVRVRDLDGDGHPDLLWSGRGCPPSMGGKIAWSRQDPANLGHFLADQLVGGVAEGASIAVGDLNHDGKLDVAAASGQILAIFFQRASAAGVFDPGPSFDLGAIPPILPLAVGDFDGDQLDDVATIANNTVTYFAQNGQQPGAFKSPRTVGVSGAQWMFAGDANDDGREDFVVFASGTQLLVQGSAGTFTPARTLPLSSRQRSDAVVDVNADGRNDLVGNGLLYQCEAPASAGSFSDMVMGIPNGNVTRYLDLDGNGRPELLTSDAAGTLTVVKQL